MGQTNAVVAVVAARAEVEWKWKSYTMKTVDYAQSTKEREIYSTN